VLLNQKGLHCITLGLILQLLIMQTVFQDVFNEVNTLGQINQHDLSHEEHDVIQIEGNSAFLSQAAIEGWSGSGTPNDPIIITGYSFRAAEHMFRLENTDLYFRFYDNILDGIAGIWCGIAMLHVKNGEISNNTVERAAVGIHVVDVENFNISNNVAHDNFMIGIVVENDSKNVTVSDNIVHDNPEQGICLYNPVSPVPDTVDSVITRNVVYNNGEDGILLGYTNNVNITENIIHDNVLNGITADSGNHTIVGNVISNNRKGIQISSGCNLVTDNLLEDNSYGICVTSSNNVITRNRINNCTHKGIRIYSVRPNDYHGSENSVHNNTIVNCTNYGLEIGSACSNNDVKWNNFFNNSDSCQVADNGIDNEFSQNFYNDWVELDSDLDGFVDEAYVFDGDAENSDEQPLALPCQPIPEWYVMLTTSTSINPPSPIFEVAIIGGSIIGIALVVIIILKKRSGR
jgi:parallel beta-helix repeat protein